MERALMSAADRGWEELALEANRYRLASAGSGSTRGHPGLPLLAAAQEHGSAPLNLGTGDSGSTVPWGFDKTSLLGRKI
jgi:hypothetical protein